MKILSIGINGEIEEKEYNEKNDRLDKGQVEIIIQEILGVYKNNYEINEIETNVYKIKLEDSRVIHVCVRALTPGGREQLKDEQRIQPQSKEVNYIYNYNENGGIGLIIGVGKVASETVIVAWKSNYSNASNESTGVSKQIKIRAIAEAMKNGFVQCRNRGKEEYTCVFRKEFFYFYLENYTWIHDNPIINMNQYTAKIEMYNNIEKEHNRIIFGAPGTGKSYLLNEEKEVFEGKYERVTFHPNYSYGQFVGVYKPVSSDDGVDYEYVPGPFMRVLTKAMASNQRNDGGVYLLIIEEINRANVASVFGDVFQLLDRNFNGESEYEIETSEEMRKYLCDELGGDITGYEKIKIPNNMYIWATMNSADQGVFPMDTAFKRRWDFEYLGVDNSQDKIKDIRVQLGNDKHEVKWNDLRVAINEKLLDECKANEDKLLGPYFLSNSILEANDDNLIKDNEKFLKAFKNKVIMYLFEDAVGRQKRNSFFKECGNYIIYSKICSKFDEIGEGIFGLNLGMKNNLADDE